ncbi:hypothetical protein ACFY64_40085 [Streptomyces collinus]|uniref:hypothetical protein n=1 Tax=Streptomyces collinus TaxID=42684 RepID=UPI003688B54E
MDGTAPCAGTGALAHPGVARIRFGGERGVAERRDRQARDTADHDRCRSVVRLVRDGSREIRREHLTPPVSSHVDAPERRGVSGEFNVGRPYIELVVRIRIVQLRHGHG